MTLFWIILVLSFLVFIHELGHFFMARRAGVRVEEFGFGYPPKMFRFWKDKQGTEYTVNWLPFGGFVRMTGEDPEVLSSGLPADNHAFYSKKKRARLGIIVAGAVMNFLFGAVAFGILYTKSGIPTPLNAVEIQEVREGSPAEQSGLKSGDVVVALAKDGERVSLTTVPDFMNALSAYKGTTARLVLNDGRELQVYVRADGEIPEGQGSLGVAITDTHMKHYPLWQMPFRGMWVGLQAAVNFGIFLLQALGTMFYNMIFMGIVPKDVAGPVGIVHMAQKEQLLTSGWEMILNFAAIISINLGVVNLLPIPALDGGRAVFVLLEGLVKKERLLAFERKANAIGMALLLLMIVAVSVRDVRVWVGESAWWQNFKR